MRPYRPFPFLLSILLAFLAVHAGAAEPRAKPPAGVAALPAKSARHLDELLAAAEKYRGLKSRRPVAAGSLGTEMLREKMAESMRKDLPPETLRAVEASLKAFGLIPETMDLGRYLPELLSSQVAGFYDPDRKYLALVRPAGGRGLAKPEEDMILVHELTHALQDQSFDLRKLQDPDPLSDAGTARGALVEGDATLVMIDYAAGANVETFPGMDSVLGQLLANPDKFLAMAPDLPGGKEMAGAPAWIRDNLLFGYLQGAAFCVNTRRRGGQPLLDHAFDSDPPRSTEQILHPEKWHTRRDDPVEIQLPDLSAELPGYRKVAEGVMGEMTVRTLLREGLKDAGRGERAATAAGGWGGDRFAVYEKTGAGRLVAWVTEWDTEADATELRQALEPMGGGWEAVAAGPSRVVVLRGASGLGAEERQALLGRLAAATVRRPENREIDLPALGARPAG